MRKRSRERKTKERKSLSEKFDFYSLKASFGSRFKEFFLSQRASRHFGCAFFLFLYHNNTDSPCFFAGREKYTRRTQEKVSQVSDVSQENAVERITFSLFGRGL